MVRSVVPCTRAHRSYAQSDVLRIDRSSQDVNKKDTGVLITSIHRAKGLEWPTVILPELSEGVFPASDADIDDERRLFYVATTRAREQLIMICPFDRNLVAWTLAEKGGVPDATLRLASRFLYESNLSVAQRIGSALDAGHPPSPALTDPAAGGNRYLDALSAAKS